MAQRRLQSRVLRIFTIQIAVVSLAAIFGVIAAAWIVEDVLIREALEGEARHFWDRYAQNPDAALPDTDNLLGHLALQGDLRTVPAALQAVQPGFHRLHWQDSEPLVHVSERQGDRLFLVFDEDRVSGLALFFGIAPLAVVLVIIYSLAFFSYRWSSRMMSPLVQLAERLQRFPFQQEQLPALELNDIAGRADLEANVLIDALNQFTRRLRTFVDRERTFTREASHELRTPLAVIKGSLELIASQERPLHEQKALERIRRATLQMESLIETLLTLAREPLPRTLEEPVVLNDVVAIQLDMIRAALRPAAVQVRVRNEALVELPVPEKVLEIVTGNLLRNAFQYTEAGQIEILLEPNSLTVRDTGIGMSEEQVARAFDAFYRGAQDPSRAGFGLGLAIVKRLCDQYGWQIRVESAPGKGTAMQVRFAPQEWSKEASSSPPNRRQA